MKHFAGILGLVLSVLLVTELSFRVYLYGVYAILPWRMNSFTQIHDSGLVQAATTPGVTYELKPDLSTWYKGVRFYTNSAGLRDREYPHKADSDTFRIAVLGSSWTMGSGVDLQHVWHSVLEDRLNHESGRVRFELINFAVDQYGLGEIIATLEQKVPAWRPDMIIITLTYYTPTVIWQDEPPPYQVQKRRHPLWDLHSLRVLDRNFQLGIFPPQHDPTLSDYDHERVEAQLIRARTHLESYAQAYGIPVVVARLAFSGGWLRSIDRGTAPMAQSELIAYIDVMPGILESGYSADELRVSLWDSHPNALGHALIADIIFDELSQRRLLPSKSIELN